MIAAPVQRLDPYQNKETQMKSTGYIVQQQSELAVS